jgi:endonuclease/exonuclease/phosphatase (EEP) superfamily protein YafD
VTVRGALRWVLLLGAWVAVICGSVFTVLTLVGGTPHRGFAALQMVRPWLGLAVVLPFVVAVAYRRPWLAVVGGFCLIANILPVWGAVTNVDRAAMSDDAVSIYVANLQSNNATPEAKVDQALNSGADVLVVAELTPVYVEAFRLKGVDQTYPYQEGVEQAGSTGRAIYSRLPLVRAQTESTGPLSVAADVRFGAGVLRIVPFHAAAPTNRGGLDVWRDELEAVRDYFAGAGLGPTVVAGDFNAARWHPEFADILGGPAADAHEAVGKGLTPSWPTGGVNEGPFSRSGPFVRIDHALVHDAGVVDVVDLPAVGSDHLPFTVTLVPESS